MMKKLWLFLLPVLLWGLATWGQNTSNGTITAASSSCSTTGACVLLYLNSNAGAATVDISGTFSATLQFEGSVDCSTFRSVSAAPLNNPTSTATSTTGTGAWKINAAGLQCIQVRGSSYVSGTATIKMNSGSGSASTGGGSAADVVLTDPAANQTIQPTADVPAAEFKCFNGTNTANVVNFRNKTGTAIFAVDCSGNVNFAGSISSGTAPTALGSATGGFAATCASTAGSAVSGQGYIRCDSTTGFQVLRHMNGANEVPLGTAYTLASSGAIGTLSVTNGPAQIVICTATCSVTPLSPPAADYQLCVIMAAGVTGTITLNALGNSAMYGKTDGSAYGTAGTGTAVSTSTTGNRICAVGRDATHYETNGNGTFTMN